MKRFVFLTLFLFSCIYVGFSQCQVSCNNQIYVSLDPSCSAEITPDMVHEGQMDPACTYSVEVVGLDANIIEAPGTYTFKLLNANGNFCWGTIVAEDKLPPVPNCECETPYMDDGMGGLVENPNCVFRCYDIWDLEILEEPGGNNELLPDVDANEPTDNCYDFADPAINIKIIDGPNCDDKIVERSILYSYPEWDGSTGYVECTQQFLFKSIDYNSLGTTLDGEWPNYDDESPFDYHTPEEYVDLPCGHGTSPEEIAAYFDLDTPGRPAGKASDDYPNTPNIVEFNEGYAYAYPYVVVQGWRGGYHAKPIINNICNIYASYTDQFIAGCGGVGSDCKGNEKVLRTWTLLDWCTSNTSTFTQVIATKDTEAPTVSNGPITLSVDPWDCTKTIVFPDPEHLHDNCDSDLTYSIQAPVGITIAGNTAYDVPKGTHTFYYVASDCCGNTGSYPVEVNIIDNTPPTVITTENLVVNLTNDLDGDGIAKLFAVDVDNNSHDGCGPIHIEIRRDTDGCGFEGNDSYNDDDHSFDNPWDTDGGEFVKFCCDDIDPDNIDPLTGTAFGEVKVWIRVWDDGDMDGKYGSEGDNYNEAWANVRVEDKLDPIVVCPPHAILECNDDWETDFSLTGVPYVYLTCGELDCAISATNPSDRPQRKSAAIAPLIGVDVDEYNPSCRSGAILRTWNCGDDTNPRQCTQWIIVNPEPPRELEVEYPDDIEVNCMEFEVEEPVVVDHVCELIGVNMESDTFYFEEGACFKILNYWTVINWCQYDALDSDLNDVFDVEDDGIIPGYSTHTQVIKFLDDEAPVLTVQDTCFAATTEDCKSIDLTLKASATDNGFCGSPWLKWEVEIDAWSDWEIDWTYSSFVPSHNEFYISPTTGSGSFVSPTEDGESVCINLPDGIPSACGLEHRVLWKVHDGCGNTTTGTSYFTVEDKKKPTPYCLNLSTALMENGSVELWAKDFDAGSFDNCSEQEYLLFTFSDVVPPSIADSSLDPWYDAEGEASENDYLEGDAELWLGSAHSSAKVFDCDDFELAAVNGGVLPVEVYVWDECGNYDFCIVNLKLVDNNLSCGDPIEGMRMISGRVETEDGNPVPEVMMNVNSETVNAYPALSGTNDDGIYVFANNPEYNNYSVNGEKNDDWLNGVSTLDLVLIQRHILGLASLDSGYKMIAADANNDEQITAIDLVSLRKLILGVESEIQGNTSWRLVPSDIAMDPSNPWPFSEYRSIIDLASDMMDEDFIGVKTGDVNGSAVLIANDDTQNRSSRALDIEIKQVLEGDAIIYELHSNNFNDLVGFQFTLETSGLDFVEANSSALILDDSNFGILDGTVTISWSNTKKVTITDAPILSLKFTIDDSNTELSEVSISSSVTEAEAYTSDLNVIGINQVTSDEFSFNVSQNEPNPWSEFTVIDFELNRTKNITFSVYTTDGKLIHSQKGVYTEGKSSIKLTKDELGQTNNVLYYVLTDGEQSITKKMIRIQ